MCDKESDNESYEIHPIEPKADRKEVSEVDNVNVMGYGASVSVPLRRI